MCACANKPTQKMSTDVLPAAAGGMSSVAIAQVTGKSHKNIMRDIRALLEQGVSRLNFELTSYNRPQPNGGYRSEACYQLTRKGCLILASGYNALLREKIIDRLEALELARRKPRRRLRRTGVLLPTLPAGDVSTTLQVADLVGRPHKLVMKTVRDILRRHPEYSSLFSLSSYLDTIGNSQPLYTLTRHGFALLVMRLTTTCALLSRRDFPSWFDRVEALWHRPDTTPGVPIDWQAVEHAVRIG